MLRNCNLMLQRSVVSQAMPTELTPHSMDDNIVTEHAAFLLFHYVLGVFTRGLGILVMTCSLHLSSLLQYTRVTDVMYTGLFISPSGTSELDCATTKTDTAERSISIARESLKVFLLGALAYLQVPPLGGSRDEKWRAQ